MSTPSPLTAGCFGQDVWIRIDGRGNLGLCATFRKFTQAMIGKGLDSFVVDLRGCEHMDSTFMGTLTGLSQNLRSLGRGMLSVINVSPRNVELLENLGLNFLFHVEPLCDSLRHPTGGDQALLELPLDPSIDKEILLSDHEALAASNPANAERFRDVVEYLRQQARPS